MKRNNTSSAERRYLLTPPCLQATTHLGAHSMRAKAHMAPAPVLTGGGPAQRITSTPSPSVLRPGALPFCGQTHVSKARCTKG
ncbi:unnamed protein product, partial [Ectocarpus sp. 13 AM-2016]